MAFAQHASSNMSKSSHASTSFVPKVTFSNVPFSSATYPSPRVVFDPSFIWPWCNFAISDSISASASIPSVSPTSSKYAVKRAPLSTTCRSNFAPCLATLSSSSKATLSRTLMAAPSSAHASKTRTTVSSPSRDPNSFLAVSSADACLSTPAMDEAGINGMLRLSTMTSASVSKL